MRAIADRFGIESFEYTNISPTIHGGDEVLPSQSREMPRTRKPYVGCNAGITHFHADPHGKASICKVGRDPQVDLIAEGAGGLRRLADAADLLLTWQPLPAGSPRPARPRSPRSSKTSPRPCCGTSTRPDGTSWAMSTHLAATPTTPQAHPTWIGWSSSWTH